MKPFQKLKAFLPKTLFGRSVLIIVLPLIFVQLITTYVFIERHWTWVTRHLGRRLAGQMATVIESYEKNDDRYKLLAKRFDFRVNLSSEKPFKVIAPPHKLTRRYLIRYLNQELTYPFRVEADNNWISLHVQHPQGWITLTTQRKFLFSMTTPIFLIWSICTPILFFLIAVIFMRNQIRPIRRLADVVHRFGKGEMHIDLKPEGADEIRRATVAFRVMQERIHRQIQMRTEMLAGVSHDMRTPLTRMELTLAMMKGSVQKNELLKDVREMTKTVESYLAFSRGEDGEQTKEIPLQDFLNDCLWGIKKSLITLENTLTNNARIRSRPLNLKRGITNILENALRYGSHVWIYVNASKEFLYLSIEDNGPGIPADARMDVFKPFFRLEPSRNQKTGGTGLGLTIARDAIVSHGGTIQLADSPKGGLAVHIRLPF